RTGFDETDLEVFWSALVNMFELDRTSSRGMMACRGLYVFSHDNALGNAPAHRLFDQVVVRHISQGPARKFADYEISLPNGNLPAGVALTRLEG
ncbi:MAG: type I CRISPR-associated protein Cas7, partial [Candidatus Binataceae bacterium]